MRFYIKKAWLKSTVSLREDCSRCRAVAVFIRKQTGKLHRKNIQNV